MVNQNCAICDATGIDDRYATGPIHCECIWGQRAWRTELLADQQSLQAMISNDVLQKALRSNQMQIDALTQKIRRMEGPVHQETSLKGAEHE